VGALNQIRQKRETPRLLFCDNGSEFTSQIMGLWAYHNRVQIDFSRPGKPTDNAHVESFNGTLRAECLDVRVRDADRAKQVIEAWRREYNESRPHRSLGERTPSELTTCGKLTLKVLQKKGPINFAEIVLSCLLKDGGQVKIALPTETPARLVGVCFPEEWQGWPEPKTFLPGLRQSSVAKGNRLRPGR
jgi:hypothetical protein